MHGDLATAVVEADGHRHHRRHGGHQRRIGHRRRPHHHSGNARFGQRLRVGERAHSAPGLHRGPAAQRGRDRRHHRAIARRAAARRVEIYHVHPAGTCGGERLGHGHRIGAVGGLLFVVALAQPHHLAVKQVDRRVQLEGHE